MNGGEKQGLSVAEGLPMQSSLASVRVPAVAGLFYPAAARVLADEVDGLLSRATPVAGPVPKALIVPHAGFPYSGPIAASAYARLRPARDTIRRVVLLGPAHRDWFQGLALPSADAFRTPLGDIPIDEEAVSALRKLRQVTVRDDAHKAEHSLEVHLPFLQRLLPAFSLVPMAVGEASAADVADALAVVWGGPETVIVISSDLSHYQEYESARRLDNATAAAIERLDGDFLDGHKACGFIPIRGLLHEASRRGLQVARADLRNSGDTAGSRDEVVGYGAWTVSDR
jgi:MEMO1 family protein